MRFPMQRLQTAAALYLVMLLGFTSAQTAERSLASLEGEQLASRAYGFARRDIYSQCPSYCSSTRTNTSLTLPSILYVCGDSRLGPKVLPTELPLSTLIGSYQRFGGLCPGAWLALWTNVTSGSFIYPPKDGFQLTTEHQPLLGNITLEIGTRVDRFGSEYGTYVSPAGSPYMQRALPPSNLDTPVYDPRYPINYHVYEVVKAFVVQAGPIASWFSQPGGGVQYKMFATVGDLVTGGFLRRLDIEEFSYGGFSY